MLSINVVNSPRGQSRRNPGNPSQDPEEGASAGAVVHLDSEAIPVQLEVVLKPGYTKEEMQPMLAYIASSPFLYVETATECPSPPPSWKPTLPTLLEQSASSSQRHAQRSTDAGPERNSIRDVDEDTGAPECPQVDEDIGAQNRNYAEPYCMFCLHGICSPSQTPRQSQTPPRYTPKSRSDLPIMAPKKTVPDRIMDLLDKLLPCCVDDHMRFITKFEKGVLSRKEQERVGRFKMHLEIQAKESGKKKPTYRLDEDHISALWILVDSPYYELQKTAATILMCFSVSEDFDLTLDILDMLDFLLGGDDRELRNVVLKALESFVLTGHGNPNIVFYHQIFTTVLTRFLLRPGSEELDPLFTVPVLNILTYMVTDRDMKGEICCGQNLDLLVRLGSHTDHLISQAALKCLIAVSKKQMSHLYETGLEKLVFSTIKNGPKEDEHNDCFRTVRFASGILKNMVFLGASNLCRLMNEGELLQCLKTMADHPNNKVRLMALQTFTELSKYEHCRKHIHRTRYLGFFTSRILTATADSIEHGLRGLLLYTNESWCRRTIIAPVMKSVAFYDVMLDEVVRSTNKKVKLLMLELMERLLAEDMLVQEFYTNSCVHSWQEIVHGQNLDQNPDLRAAVTRVLKRIIEHGNKEKVRERIRLGEQMAYHLRFKKMYGFLEKCENITWARREYK